VLASWIQAIAREKPVEIFTTNYDLLLEQALEEQRVPYFDGFVGSDSAFSILSRWPKTTCRAVDTLWKIHGSINWWMTGKAKIRRSRDKVEANSFLSIHPISSTTKAGRWPYFAMLDRLGAFLRSEQCVLLTCGYSFGDEHINAYIGQGLSGNPNASCSR